MFQENITIGIKTFLRPTSLKYCLMRLRQYFPKIKILVADDSTEEIKKINQKLSQKFNAEYLDLEFDSGLGFGRNKMIEKTTTKYYLTLDDDSLIDNRFDLSKLYQLMEETNLDIIACQRGVNKKASKHYYHFFDSVKKTSEERFGKYLIYYDQEMKPERKINNQLKMNLYQTHLINENYIGKTEILKKNLYQNEIKIGQHQLHFAKLFLNKVSIGYCPDIIIGEKVNYPEEYLKYRSRKGTWIKPDDIKMILIK